MKPEVSNLIIIGVTPLIALGAYKIYNGKSMINHEKKIKLINEESNKNNTEKFNEISTQTENSNDSSLSPIYKKKNSLISSRSSSIVDLTELENIKSNSTVKDNIEDDIHIVELSSNINHNKKITYFSYVKRWFGS